MRMLKLFAIALVFVGFAACDKGDGPDPRSKFGPNEGYVFGAESSETVSAVIGTPIVTELYIQPGDGSVQCKWLLAPITVIPAAEPGGEPTHQIGQYQQISTDPILQYNFTTTGTYALRFEAARGTGLRWRQYTVTVSAPAPAR